MKITFTSINSVAVLLLLLIFNLTAFNANAQQPNPATEERDRGIQLYQQGDAKGAIEALRDAVTRNKEDGDAWHYLGLALLLKEDKGEARRAFQKAATIRVSNLAAFLPISNNQEPQSLRMKNADRYEAAIESVQRYLEVTSNPTEDWRAELEALRFYHDYYGGLSNEESIMSPREVTTRLRILSKPAPNFSGTRASGTSILRAVFGADGSVKHVLVLRKVDPAFDQACKEAARRVEFTPAIKDGRAVSTILQLEYNRSLY